MLSIICPVFNEELYINDLILSLQQDNLQKEILIIDGGSSDRTVEIFNKNFSLEENIKLISNPDRYVSKGFNKAFKIAAGNYIAFLGAHAKYPKDFFSLGIQHLAANDADAVGGPLIQKGKGVIGSSIAYCMSSKFGVGDTEFRTQTKKSYVDSVAFAIYKREVFEKIGLMDEELIRNQDDEFHYRMNANGLKILMVPEMACTYFVRGTIKSLFNQYFGYGLFKPLVFRKVRRSIRLRHIIPSIFIFYLFSMPLILIVWWWCIPFMIYILIDLVISFFNNQPVSQKFTCTIVFPIIHVAYGLGFLIGLKKLL